MLTFQESRVVSAMVEKAMTTPDNYPMSLNAIVTACNQVSNRDPVVTFEEGVVERTLRGLADRGLAKMVHRPGDRVVKYRHAIDAGLEVDDRELALLAVLMLRGDQTPGELRQRTQRYVSFGSLPEVEVVLEGLRHRDPPVVARLERQPGQKEHRYRHLLVDDGGSTAVPDAGSPDAGSPDAGSPDAGSPDAGPPSAGSPSAPPEALSSGPASDAAGTDMQRAVTALRDEFTALRDENTALRDEVTALGVRLERIEREFGID